MAGAILTLNAGPSRLKLSLSVIGPTGALAQVARGEVHGIGDVPHLVMRDPNGALLVEQRWPAGGGRSHEDFLQAVLSFADRRLGLDTLSAAGHCVAHGGTIHAAPARMTEELLAELEALSPLAPLHQPASLMPVHAIMALRPDLPQVACFDTAFHQTMPAVATRLPLPYALEQDGIRRYGFHGLSCEYVARRLAEQAPALAGGRVVIAHLGDSASLCALRQGRSVDTTMGFSALDGLMMGTCCGSVDPGILLHLQQQHGYDVHALEDMLYHRAGLLGVSGVSGDMQTLLASSEPRARLAIELFIFRVVREIGALAMSLDGLDTLVFTAGIGEHAPLIRAGICHRLNWLGARLDEVANQRGETRINAADSTIEIRILPSDADAMIAHHTLRVIRPRLPAG